MYEKEKAWRKPGLLLVFVLTVTALTAQRQVVAHAAIEKALSENNLAEAEALVKKGIALSLSARQADSLNHYVFYTGKIEQQKTGVAAAMKKVEALVTTIKSLSPPPATLRQTYIEAGEYFGFAGKNNLAYKANEEALRYTMAMPGKTPNQVGMVLSNMGTYAQRMGDLALSTQHQRESIKYKEADPHPDPEMLYVGYNNMGAIMWYASKLDSSLLYFEKALATLKKLEPTPLNKYYRPALVLNNVSGIYSQQGNSTRAIEALKTAILHLKTFIADKEPHLKKNAAVTLQFEATDNLAGIYKELGDYKQAHQLLLYSYQQKQQVLGKDNPGVFISQILLGQLYYAMKEKEKAVQFLNSGLAAIAKADGDYTYYKADACNTLALLYEEEGQTEKATSFYQQADALYEESLAGEYDNIYLEFLANASLFYAGTGQSTAALRIASKAYDYIAKNDGPQTLPASYQLLNLSQVHYLSGNYKEALRYSEQSLRAVDAAMTSGTSLLDSIKMELKKPKAILQKAKAAYALLTEKDEAHLRPIQAELSEALAILERRKTILSDAQDISLLMADQTELIRFLEKITLHLYTLTRNSSYLNSFVSLHESALYNRIRSRLDKTDTVQFAHVPREVQQKEKNLKAAITASLQGAGSHAQKMQAYFAATDAWTRYQNWLKQTYPQYYNLRYASIFKPLESVQKKLPANTTLVRYFFSEKELYALVADEGRQQMFPLKTEGLDKAITALAAQAYDAKKAGELLFTLYQQLWAPFASQVRHESVVIIPDGILFNLSFETLTPRRISSFSELATASLLARHNIAYHYSLFLLAPQKHASAYNSSFVAFAPGFTDRLKQPYREKANDGAFPDMGYLSLLPQPFAIDLASRTQAMLGGQAFLYEESTVGRFKQQAGNHRIIHIGTHAESNNLHPEFSRLIFAKNMATAGEDNYLYLPEIYNCDLTADLAVLTACETGRPGYEDGEGMVSLAHAFNYAGSESILTSLWKIDEQASARLLELFYKNLLSGMPKDEALRKAKLTYLETAEGRARSPQYWAGLVIMGDTSPVALMPATHTRWLWLGAGFLIAGAVALLWLQRRRKRRKRHPQP